MKRSLRRLPPIAAPDGPRLRVRHAGDFVALVPYLLGFHPEESVVAIFLDRSRVALTARLDLPSFAAVPAIVDEFAGLARQCRARAVVFVGYSADERGRAVLEALVTRTRLRLLEALFVSPERWWSLLCRGGCCPPEGTPYDLSSHPLCAEAVLAGLSAVGHREDLAELVIGPSDADFDVLEGLSVAALSDLIGVEWRAQQRRMRTLVEGYLADPQPLSDARCAELAALCTDLRVRDIAWALMTREHVEEHLQLWLRVVARTIPPLAPGPVGLVALSAWIAGNGALLNCCIAQLEALDPDYSLLEICRDLSWRAVPPSFWDRMSADLRADPELLAGC